MKNNATSILTSSALILADEPTGNLDSETSGQITALFRKIREVSSATILLVTHDQEIAKQGGRTIKMRDGNILSLPKRWKPRPVSPRSYNVNVIFMP